jgi:hypothetical protein
MTDAATAGSNSGTGGDFTVNGVLDTAGRAPNQFNCSASEFDGSNDYMSRGSANYGSAQKSTGSVLFNASSDSSGQRLFSFDGDDGQINVNPSGGEIDILYKVNPWSGIMLAQIATNLSVNRNYSLQWSFDTSDTGKRHFYLNGVSVLSSTTFSYYDNSTTALYGNWGIGATSTGSSKFTGSIGELWFEWDVYRDLSSDNPFWDSDTNLPKPVRQVIDETGTTPLMAVPMRGDNAGINLGTDDNFTVRSGPYTGARGGSEFWARSAKFETSNSDYMGRGSLSGVGSSSSAFTTVGYYRRGTLDGDRYFGIGHENTVYRFKIEVHQSSTQIDLRLSARNSSGTEIMGFSGQNITTDYVIFLLSFDTNSSGSQTAYIYSDAGLINDTSNWGIYNLGSNWDMSDYTALGGTYGQGTGGTGYGTLDGDMGFFYLDDSYIDFSQESNRNLFVDQLGYPKDLTPAIEAGDIAEPLIYMKFDDTSALGTNSGTGGDFSTINGTITAGADVNPNA